MKRLPLHRPEILALTLLLIIQIAYAQTQENTSFLYSGIYRVNSINIEIKENGVANVREELVVDRPNAKILLPKTSKLDISDSSGKLEHKSDSLPDGQMITFNPRSYFPESDGRLWIVYTSNHLTHKSGSIWTLSFSSLATPAHTVVGLIFPPGAKILNLKPDIPRYPANLSNPLSMYPQDAQFSFDCDYEVNEMESDGIPTGLILVAGGIIIIIFILIILIVVVVSKRGRSGEKIEDQGTQSGGEIGTHDTPPEATEDKGEIKESVLNMLNERETEIVRVITGSGEKEITQAYIYKTTGIPKATLSDTIKRLESRNILESTPEGRTKWIKLKKWVFN